MIIIQLDSIELSNVIQKAVRKVLEDQSNPSHPEGDQILTVQEAAKFLDIAIPTIYSKASRQEIPVNKRGNRLYFSKQELTEWIKGGRKKTIAELEVEAEASLSRSRKKKGVRV